MNDTPKLNLKIVTIMALVLLSTTIAVGTGECTAEACRYCDMEGTDKFCTLCHKQAMSGTGINRKCSGGITIAGCLTYKTTDDTATGRIYCAECDAEKGFMLFAGVTKDLNKCSRCDFSKNYWKNGACLTATPVQNCERYKNNEDKCVDCGDKYRVSTLENKCVGCSQYSYSNQTNGYSDSFHRCNFVTAPMAGCTEYKSKDECSRCEKGYILTSKSGKCVICDFSINYLKDGTCTAATPVEGFSQYMKDEDRCGACGSSYLLSEKSNKCFKVAANTCLEGYHPVSGADCAANIQGCKVAKA